MRVYYKKKSGTIKPVGAGKPKHVIWGDWLDVEEEQPPSNHYSVDWKVWDRAAGTTAVVKHRVPKADCQDDALLEMIFLDVGQGDGCIVSVPDGNRQRTLIIDAGQHSNTHNFLKWRFRYVDADAAFHAAVITHPDQDHYRGFVPILKDKRVSFEHIYHNGLVERKTARDSDVIGPRKNGLCTEIYEDRAALEALVSQPAKRGIKVYPNLMWAAVNDPQRFPDIRMASTRHGEESGGKTWLPGFAPEDGKAAIEILGPVPEATAQGALALRTFGDAPHDGKFDVGKTKNGHSIILRLEYGGFTAVFGGDLNRPSEDYLLRHYGGIGEDEALAQAVPAARQRLAADLLKCCHHGSADVTDEFLEAVNAFAFVVSSGDEEGHVHPRPDVLGLLGRKGRSARPLILCTEILRSTPSSLRLGPGEIERFDELLAAFDTAADDEARKRARNAVLGFIDRRTRRLVTEYGAITMRTDGKRMLIAFRKEASASNRSPWQVFEYEAGDAGWVPVEKEGGH